MGTHADMTDGSFFLQLPYIFHKFSVDHPFKFFCRINEMDHSHVYVVGLKPCQKILKCRFHLLKIPGTDILTGFPDGTNMSLYDPVPAPSLKRQADIRAHIRFRHPAVQDVDSLLFACINHSLYFLCIVAFQPFCAKTDLTDLDPRVS